MFDPPEFSASPPPDTTFPPAITSATSTHELWKQTLDDRHEVITQMLKNAEPPAGLERMLQDLADVSRLGLDGSLNPLAMPETSRGTEYDRYQELVLYGTSRLRSILAAWIPHHRHDTEWHFAFDREMVDILTFVGEATVVSKPPVIPAITAVVTKYWQPYCPSVFFANWEKIQEQLNAPADDFSKTVATYTNHWWSGSTALAPTIIVGGFRRHADEGLGLHKSQLAQYSKMPLRTGSLNGDYAEVQTLHTLYRATDENCKKLEQYIKQDQETLTQARASLQYWFSLQAILDGLHDRRMWEGVSVQEIGDTNSPN